MRREKKKKKKKHTQTTVNSIYLLIWLLPDLVITSVLTLFGNNNLLLTDLFPLLSIVSVICF